MRWIPSRRQLEPSQVHRRTRLYTSEWVSARVQLLWCMQCSGLGTLYSELGQLTEASEAFRTSLTYEQTSLAWLGLAQVERKREDLKGSIAMQ